MDNEQDEIAVLENEIIELAYQLRFAKDEKIRLGNEVREIRQSIFNFLKMQRYTNSVHYMGITVGVLLSISSFLIDDSIKIPVIVAGIGIIATAVVGILEMKKNHKRYRTRRERSDADDFLLNMRIDEKENG